MHLYFRYYLIAILLCSSLWVSGQISILGVTKDSVTHQTIHFVSISVSGKVSAISDENGFFRLTCHAGDTLLFSRVGHKAKRLIPFADESNLIVLMAESTTVLNSITIYGDYKPQGKAEWKRYIILPKIFENPTMKDPNGMVQTFGPGVNIPGLLSYFNSENREKRKIKRADTELIATRVFREVMASDVVKQDIMKLFSLTEKQYFKKIEAFNLQNPEAPYLKDRDEIINLIIGFFALKEK
jgi:hypothetical protein